MILTDFDIEEAIRFGEIEITPFIAENLGSNSYDLTLFPQLMCYDYTYRGNIEDRSVNTVILDSRKQNKTHTFDIPEDGTILEPNKLYLARTNESTYCEKCVPMIEGKSSIARLGINIHQTAGFGDVGFRGTWTLEITVVHPIIIYPNMKIAQICFHSTNGSCKVPYGAKQSAKYQNQTEIQASKNHLNV